jgi:hypothetical protein
MLYTNLLTFLCDENTLIKSQCNNLLSLITILKQITSIQLDTYDKLISIYSHCNIQTSFPSDIYIPKQTLIANLSEARNFATGPGFKEINQKCLQLQLELEKIQPYILPEWFSPKNIEETLKCREQHSNIDKHYKEQLSSNQLFKFCNSIFSYICSEKIEEDLLDMLHTFTLKHIDKMHKEFFSIHENLVHNLEEQSKYYALLSSQQRNRVHAVASICKDETKSEITDITMRLVNINNDYSDMSPSKLQKSLLLTEVTCLLTSMNQLTFLLFTSFGKQNGVPNEENKNRFMNEVQTFSYTYLHSGCWLQGVGLVKDI